MKQAAAVVGYIVAGAALLFGIPWIATGNSLALYRYFAPQYEEARREVFVNTPSFVQGKQQYLSRLYKEWSLADEGHRGVICDLARHEAITLDPKNVPSNLKEWECIQ